MDRRQKKTRRAIFSAFTDLLQTKRYSDITVGEIIERADVGRATFYSHFETKDYLLKELCRELFCHVFDSLDGNISGHSHVFACESDEDIFLHLLRHLEKNDNGISTLLISDNDGIFTEYFKRELTCLVKGRNIVTESAVNKDIPEDFTANHISASFVETVRWWFSKGRNEKAETVHRYFLAVLGIG